jgi:integrase
MITPEKALTGSRLRPQSIATSSLENALMTFRELAEEWQTSELKPPIYDGRGRKKAGRRTLTQNRHHLKTLIEHFGLWPSRTIKISHIEAFKNSRLEKGLTERSIENEVALLSSILSFAVARGWLEKNVCLGQSFFKHRRRRFRVLTNEEEHGLLAVCNTPQRTYLFPLFICAIETGMRLSEILSLERTDVDFGRKLIRARRFTRFGTFAREIPMSDRLAAALEDFWTQSQREHESLIWKPRTGDQLNLTKIFRDAGLEDFRFSDFRVTAAVRFYQGGASFSNIHHMLGHSSVNSTYQTLGIDGHKASRESLRRHIEHAGVSYVPNPWPRSISREETLAKGDPEGSSMLFSTLVENYAASLIEKVEYIHDGQSYVPHNFSSRLYELLRLCKDLGKYRISKIRYKNLEKLVAKRRAAPTRFGKARKPSYIERELSALRRVFKFAISQGWLTQSPFSEGPPLIPQAEKKRKVNKGGRPPKTGEQLERDRMEWIAEIAAAKQRLTGRGIDRPSKSDIAREIHYGGRNPKTGTDTSLQAFNHKFTNLKISSAEREAILEKIGVVKKPQSSQRQKKVGKEG